MLRIRNDPKELVVTPNIRAIGALGTIVVETTEGPRAMMVQKVPGQDRWVAVTPPKWPVTCVPCPGVATGIGSVIDLAGQVPFVSVADDAALARDWAAVGHDLCSAYTSVVAALPSDRKTAAGRSDRKTAAGRSDRKTAAGR
jgi:hypothetical protein